MLALVNGLLAESFYLCHDTIRLMATAKRIKVKTRRTKRPVRLLKSFMPSRWFEWASLGLFIFVLLITIIYYNLPFTRTETHDSDIPFKIENIQDSSLELGQQQKRQSGENGTKETITQIRHTLSGRKISETLVTERVVKSPVSQINAQGTKRYQYMWCSNGTYRYYTNDEFKNPQTGFTHQSRDYCSQNGAGHMTGLADTAPTPAPSTRAPTFTHCYDTGFYSSSINCYSY